MTANPLRGEAGLAIGGRLHVLRPTFSALVAAEAELGPLFALVERAGSGELRLSEMACLFWHCLDPVQGISREAVGEAVVEAGLAACAVPLRAVLGQILKGTACERDGRAGTGLVRACRAGPGVAAGGVLVSDPG